MEAENFVDVDLHPNQRGLFVTEVIKIPGFATLFYDAYQSQDPLQTLMSLVRNFPGLQIEWKHVQELMQLIRWNEKEKQDPHHPMAFLKHDLQQLRERMRKKDNEEDLEMTLWSFCFYATCMPQVWCVDIVNNMQKGKANQIHLCKEINPCAYSSPNKAVPWIWFNANGHASINMVAHNMADQYRDRCLRVALYRKYKMGIVNTIKPEFTFDKKTDAQPINMSLLHIAVDTSDAQDGTGPIKFVIFKGVENWTFMIFLTEGVHYNLVSVILNDNGTLLKYPVAVHKVHRVEEKEESNFT